MIKFILLFSFSFLFVACEEGGSATPSTSSVVAAPINAEQNVLKVSFTVSESTPVQIEIQPWDDNIGWDMANAYTINGVVDANNTEVEYQFTQRCRVYVKKAATSSASSFSFTLNGQQSSVFSMGAAYYIHEQNFLDLTF